MSNYRMQGNLAFHDIPASPGYRLKQWDQYRSDEITITHIVAWRMFEDYDKQQNLIVVIDPARGILVTDPGSRPGTNDWGTCSWAILLPGEVSS